MVQIPELICLEEHANLHVRQLKACLEKHSNMIRDDKDESSDSSILTLGLSQFDANYLDLLDSDKDDPMDSSTENHISPAFQLHTLPQAQLQQSMPQTLISSRIWSPCLSHQTAPLHRPQLPQP